MEFSGGGLISASLRVRWGSPKARGWNLLRLVTSCWLWIPLLAGTSVIAIIRIPTCGLSMWPLGSLKAWASESEHLSLEEAVSPVLTASEVTQHHFFSDHSPAQIQGKEAQIPLTKGGVLTS